MILMYNNKNDLIKVRIESTEFLDLSENRIKSFNL